MNRKYFISSIIILVFVYAALSYLVVNVISDTKMSAELYRWTKLAIDVIFFSAIFFITYIRLGYLKLNLWLLVILLPAFVIDISLHLKITNQSAEITTISPIFSVFGLLAYLTAIILLVVLAIRKKAE